MCVCVCVCVCVVAVQLEVQSNICSVSGILLWCWFARKQRCVLYIMCLLSVIMACI